VAVFDTTKVGHKWTRLYSSTTTTLDGRRT
jgi:hypothetical protein